MSLKAVMQKNGKLKCLLMEINELEQSNESKDVDLNLLKTEIIDLSTKLVEIQEENEELRKKEVPEEEDSVNVKSLSEELGIVRPRSTNVSFCDPCNYASTDENTLRRHNDNSHETHPNIKQAFDMKFEKAELEKKIYIQKLKLSSDMFKLGEKEYHEKQYCNCKGYCNIYHKEHNWERSVVVELQSKYGLRLIDYHCQECGDNFVSKESLKNHLKTRHTNTG